MIVVKYISETSEQGREEFLEPPYQMLMSFENSIKPILTSSLNLKPLNKSFE